MLMNSFDVMKDIMQSMDQNIPCLFFHYNELVLSDAFYIFV